MKVVILGAGLVGTPMAIDLSKSGGFELLVADVDANALSKLEKQHDIRTECADLSDANNLKRIIADADMVLNAVPGHMGFETLKTVIQADKDVVDIAFFPEDPFLLDDLAKKHGVTAVVDCGVAPGMSNMLTGYVDNLLDKTEMAITYVGGLPEIREWPYEYKAVFSPVDVIEEYTRPARYIENGKLVIRPALSDAELIDFPGIGTLEAFNSDGLRTLAATIDAPNLKEKTLRYPGHIQKMAVLRETGFFSKEKIEIKGVSISPLDFTAELLFPKWELREGESDITVMQVIVEGFKDGEQLRYTYDLFDKLDRKTNIHSMARTTGYTATTVIRMIRDGLFNQKGIIPPEYIGKDTNCVQYVLDQLKERDIVYREKIEKI